MPWVRISDQLPVYPKIIGLSDAAFRLYITAICWADMHQTGGALPAFALEVTELSILPGASLPAMRELAVAGLVTATDDGWQITDEPEGELSCEPSPARPHLVLVRNATEVANP